MLRVYLNFPKQTPCESVTMPKLELWSAWTRPGNFCPNSKLHRAGLGTEKPAIEWAWAPAYISCSTARKGFCVR